MNSNLVRYLNDHLGGSTAGLLVLDNLISHAEDEEQRQFYTALKHDISTDRETLQSLIEKTGAQPSVLRKVGGWAAGKASQIKFTVEDFGDEPLGRLEALEMLMLGIQGKAALWRALRHAALQIPSLQPTNFVQLEARAQEQSQQVERRRLDAAANAFSGVEIPDGA